MLRCQADVNTAKHGGATPLWIAADNGHLEAVKMLLGAHADANQCRTDGISPLHACVRRQYVQPYPC